MATESLPTFQKASLSVSQQEGQALMSSTTSPRDDDSFHHDFGQSRSRRSSFWVKVLAAIVCVAMLGFLAHEQFKYGDESAQAKEDPSSNVKDIISMAPTEGSSNKKKKKKEKKKDKSSGLSACEDGNYSKRTLKLAYELPFASLFRDTRGQKKYEASSVVLGPDGNAYAVCDSSWAISKFNSKLEPFAEDNLQIGDPAREEDDSGYEALFLDEGSFYVVRESVQHQDESYHAIIEKLALGDNDYEVEEACSAEFEFEGDSKGFEGAISVRDLNNKLVILGLCEGNHCSEERKNDVGNGQIVAMRKEQQADGSCQWSTIRTISVPSTAAFRDYSAMTLETSTGRVAISSQEESQVWIGLLLGKNDAGLWDIDAIEFDPDVAKLYDFPRDNNCDVVYCNVEGIHWINSDMLMAVSDKMKSKGKQDFRCFDKDQSVHVFVLP